MDNLASYMDHTLLKPEAKLEDYLQAADLAKKYSCASLCIPPTWIKDIYPQLENTPVILCTVVGFPFGYSSLGSKLCDTSDALDAGAREIDVVMNIAQFLSRNYLDVVEEIEAIANKCHTYGAKLKVIIETAYLTDEQKVKACQLILDGGAEFVKTSTGYAPTGATVADIKLIAGVVGGKLGIKASGGIRDQQMAIDLINAGATRLGTSQTEAILCGQVTDAQSY